MSVSRSRSGSGRLATALLGAVGALNLAPALLAVLPDRIPGAYGVTPGSAGTVLLVRHRAVLLGLVGAWLTAAARVPALRTAAIVGATVSKVSFLALVAREPVSAEIRRVARADVLGLGALAVVTALGRAERRR